MAGLLVRERARSSARRVRATCRRWRQAVVTLLMVTASFFDVVGLQP